MWPQLKKINKYTQLYVQYTDHRSKKNSIHILQGISIKMYYFKIGLFFKKNFKI